MAGKKKAEEQEQRSLEENFSELEELIEQLEAEDIWKLKYLEYRMKFQS